MAKATAQQVAALRAAILSVSRPVARSSSIELRAAGAYSSWHEPDGMVAGIISSTALAATDASRLLAAEQWEVFAGIDESVDTGQLLAEVVADQGFIANLINEIAAAASHDGTDFGGVQGPSNQNHGWWFDIVDLGYGLSNFLSGGASADGLEKLRSLGNDGAPNAVFGGVILGTLLSIQGADVAAGALSGALEGLLTGTVLGSWLGTAADIAAWLAGNLGWTISGGLAGFASLLAGVIVFVLVSLFVMPFLIGVATGMVLATVDQVADLFDEIRGAFQKVLGFFQRVFGGKGGGGKSKGSDMIFVPHPCDKFPELCRDALGVAQNATLVRASAMQGTYFVLLFPDWSSSIQPIRPIF
jgi:hypothetical protein